MNVLSLFDGISAGQVALERAGILVDKYYASEIDKYAIQVTQKNYPNTIQIGDVTKINFEEYKHIDLLIGGSPCFIAGTKIITKDKYKNIEDVNVEDEVITHTGNFRKVLKIGGKFSNTILVYSQGLKPIETTEEHPFYVRNMERKWDNKKRKYYRNFSEPCWKNAKDLTKGDFVGININTLSENILNLTKEECYILGRYIADGHTCKDYRTSEDRPNDRHWQLILSIGSHTLNNFKKNISENTYNCYPHTKSIHRIVFSNKRLVEIAENYCGCRAKNKIIPQIFINLPLVFLEKVLEGYLDGDGSYKDGVYKATSISENLIMTLSQAVAKVYRVNSSYVYTKRPNTCIIENRIDTFSISFTKEMKKQSNATVIENIIWLPVKCISKTNESKMVYNLEVEEDNSYTANNAIVHNCQSISIIQSKTRQNLDGKSKLFFEFIKALETIKPKYFLFENVASMTKETKDTMNKLFNCDAKLINSNCFSAQNRPRLYWTNIDVNINIEESKLALKDILEKEVEEKYFYNYPLKNINMDKQVCANMEYKNNEMHKRIFNPNFKCHTLTTCGGGNTQKKVMVNGRARKLTPLEYERLQTFSDGYTNILSSTQRYNCLGNSWTVDVIVHILKEIK